MYSESREGEEEKEQRKVNLHNSRRSTLSLTYEQNMLIISLRSKNHDTKDVVIERIKRIEELTAGITALRGGTSATSFTGLTPSAFETALLSVDKNHSNGSSPSVARNLQPEPGGTVRTGTATQSSGQIYFSGLLLGTVDSQNGMPSLSSVGANWIFKATGQWPSFDYLGNDDTVPTRDQLTPLRRQIRASTSQDIKLPKQSTVKSLLQTFLESDLCLLFPVIDHVLFENTINLAYEVGSKAQSTERLTAKACVFAFASFMGVQPEYTAFKTGVEIDSYASEADRLARSMIEYPSLTMLQTMLMLVCGTQTRIQASCSLTVAFLYHRGSTLLQLDAFGLALCYMRLFAVLSLLWTHTSMFLPLLRMVCL